MSSVNAYQCRGHPMSWNINELDNPEMDPRLWMNVVAKTRSSSNWNKHCQMSDFGMAYSLKLTSIKAQLSIEVSVQIGKGRRIKLESRSSG